MYTFLGFNITQLSSIPITTPTLNHPKYYLLFIIYLCRSACTVCHPPRDIHAASRSEIPLPIYADISFTRCTVAYTNIEPNKGGTRGIAQRNQLVRFCSLLVSQGLVAQLVEHLIEVQKVSGSKPA